MGLWYRVRQFGHTLLAKTDPQAMDEARARLTPQQWELFERLQPAEKDHALRMLHRLIEQGHDQPDLLVATLLHDVGKLRHRLNPIERVMIVLAGAVIPNQAQRWGDLPTGDWERVPSWRKAFIIAEQHARWGAEMAQQAGVSSLAETLIREHHQPQAPGSHEAESGLLHKLWVVDNES